MHLTSQPTENHIELSPPNPTATVIWLHGLGADGSDFVPIVSELHLPAALAVRFIFPHAPMMPVTINGGYVMRAWFDIYDISKMGKVDETGINNSIKTVDKLIENELQRGIKSEHIFLAGFSQGAVIALSTGLASPKPLAGIIALSGYLPQPEKLLQHANAANAKTPIFIAHGTEDTVVPYTLGHGTYTLLEKAGYPAVWHNYPMPHSVCAQEIKDISSWMQGKISH